MTLTAKTTGQFIQPSAVPLSLRQPSELFVVAKSQFSVLYIQPVYFEWNFSLFLMNRIKICFNFEAWILDNTIYCFRQFHCHISIYVQEKQWIPASSCASDVCVRYSHSQGNDITITLKLDKRLSTQQTRRSYIMFTNAELLHVSTSVHRRSCSQFLRDDCHRRRTF